MTMTGATAAEIIMPDAASRVSGAFHSPSPSPSASITTGTGTSAGSTIIKKPPSSRPTTSSSTNSNSSAGAGSIYTSPLSSPTIISRSRRSSQHLLQQQQQHAHERSSSSANSGGSSYHSVGASGSNSGILSPDSTTATTTSSSSKDTLLAPGASFASPSASSAAVGASESLSGIRRSTSSGSRKGKERAIEGLEVAQASAGPSSPSHLNGHNTHNEEKHQRQTDMLQSITRVQRKWRDHRRTRSVPSAMSGMVAGAFGDGLSGLSAVQPKKEDTRAAGQGNDPGGAANTGIHQQRSAFPTRPPLVRSGAVPGTNSALGLSLHGWQHGGSTRGPDSAQAVSPTTAAGGATVTGLVVSVERASSDASNKSAGTSGTGADGGTSSSCTTSSSSSVPTSSASSNPPAFPSSSMGGTTATTEGNTQGRAYNEGTTPDVLVETPATSIAGSPYNEAIVYDHSKVRTSADELQQEQQAEEEKEDVLPPLPSKIDTSVAANASAVVELVPLDKTVQRRLRLYRALIELVETERSYADDLAVLVMVFFKNLQRMPFFGSAGDIAEQNWRIETVSRNAEDLLRLHQQVAVRLESILAKHQLVLSGNTTPEEEDRMGGLKNPYAASSEEVQKAMSAELDVAIVNVARYFVSLAPTLSMYQTYCSRHSEALGLIHEAERRSSDWQAYETHCTEILRWQMHAQVRRRSKSPTLPTSVPTSPTATVTPMSPASGRAVEAHEFARGRERSPSSAHLLLHFHDFFVKPVQRIVLYRLVLSTLVKHASDNDLLRTELEDALEAVKVAADQVDQAGKRREHELLAEMLIWRIQPHYAIPQTFLRSLGSVVLAGPLQTLHHHTQLAPLEAPLRFKYFGMVLFKGWLLFAKVRKSGNYEAKHFFPLWNAKLTCMEDENAAMPHSFRISLLGHHFELAAANVKEKELWTSSLASVIEVAPTTSPDGSTSFPISLPVEEGSPGAGVQSKDLHDKEGEDPLLKFLASVATETLEPAPTSSPADTRSHDTSSPGAAATNNVQFQQTSEVLIRTHTPAQRNALDRSMIISAHCLSVRGMAAPSGRDSTGVNSTSIQWLAAPPATLGATVGAAIGLSRLTNGSSSGTMRLQRRRSMIEMPAAPSPKMRVLDVPSKTSNLLSAVDVEERGAAGADGWKTTLRKRVSRSRPSSFYMPDSTSDGIPSIPVSVISTPTMEAHEFPVVEEPEAMDPTVVPTLKRASSKSFASSVRSVLNSSGTRPRASTLFETKSGASPRASQYAISSSFDLSQEQQNGAVPETEEFGTTQQAARPVTANKQAEPSAPRSRKNTIKRALSFRRLNASNASLESTSSPDKSLSETLRSLRQRSSWRFSRADSVSGPSKASATSSSASSVGEEGASAEQAPQLQDKRSTSSPSSPSFQRKRLNHRFLQTNRLSPMQVESSVPS